MPLITITHSTGSQGEKIARHVANRLKVPLYDDFKLQMIALDLGILSEDLDSLDERAPGLLDRILNTAPGHYLNLMEMVIYEVAREGEGVIIGHGSPLLLQEFGCAFHVCLNAHIDYRLKNIMQNYALEEKPALKMLQKADARKSGFMRYAFQLDWHDSGLYDLLINTDKLSPKSAARTIITAAQSNEVGACSLHALVAMQCLAQERQVSAALAQADINTHTLNVNVEQPGIVQISGLARSLEDKERMAQVAGQIKGIDRVSVSVALISSSY